MAEKRLTFLPEKVGEPLRLRTQEEVEAEEFYQRQRDEFITDLKLVIRKHFKRGNDAIGLSGGRPSDFGFLDDMDMAEELSTASKAAVADMYDFLYTFDPLPKEE